jgi:hypothetical protein
MAAKAVSPLLPAPAGCERHTTVSWGCEGLPPASFRASAITAVAVAVSFFWFWWRNSNGASPKKQPKVTPAYYRDEISLSRGHAYNLNH